MTGNKIEITSLGGNRAVIHIDDVELMNVVKYEISKDAGDCHFVTLRVFTDRLSITPEALS